MAYLADGGGGVSASLDLLKVLNVPEDEIAQMRKFLLGYADDLGDEKLVPPVSDQHFGGSWSGSNLGHHTRLAREALRTALLSMSEGLSGQAQALDDFVKDVSVRDAEASADMAVLEAATECITSTTQQAPTCSIPSSED